MAASHDIRSKTYPSGITRTSLKLSAGIYWLMGVTVYSPNLLMVGGGSASIRNSVRLQSSTTTNNFSPEDLTEIDRCPPVLRRSRSSFLRVDRVTANSSENALWQRNFAVSSRTSKLATIFETGADISKSLHGKDWRTSGGSGYHILTEQTRGARFLFRRLCFASFLMERYIRVSLSEAGGFGFQGSKSGPRTARLLTARNA
ncbi:hypothetical protein EMPG_17429 [Blastomyces silverae]|uniref:Uncharacterized protein n=1 Tax=Blastomyces silverae TaxID=2060906 RepID=A0A0H1B7V3_9EURO|nr:hypothetical protein EMPG_17429 [Blastomyces silverae]